ncbi:MAG TPA: DUF3667 domain-containing protein [Rudaea sp.]|nr:DUF3667 domain-containing protein [Rudaea sp.]
MTDSESSRARCTNCGASLVGEYCHVCGQKRFVESDRRFGHLLHQFVGSLTDLDGRVWRTVRALLFQPGLLSREYFEGRRARWLAPVSLFLAVSVIYFVAPLRGGDLTLQFNQQVAPEIRAQAVGPDETLSETQRSATGQWYSRYTVRWIERRVARRDAALRAASNGTTGYSMRDYRIAYDAKGDDISKALVVLHVPFAALALLLMFWRQRHYYAEHFVFALHYLAFWMIALQVVAQSINLLHGLPAGWAPPLAFYDWVMRALLAVYAVLALRRAYSTGWLGATITATGLIASIVLVNLYLYRAAQFVITFALT